MPCSSYYYQSNGLVVRSVRTVNSMLKRAIKEKEEPYTALIEYGNILALRQLSPNERLTSRLRELKY